MTSLDPIFKEGHVVEVISTSSNITHLKKMERELQESEERYRRLIELLPDGVLIHSEGSILMANPKALELINTYMKLNNKVTVSVGIASTVPASFIDKKKLIEHTDKAMYQAKMSGRNQIFCYSETS